MRPVSGIGNVAEVERGVLVFHEHLRVGHEDVEDETPVRFEVFPNDSQASDLVFHAKQREKPAKRDDSQGERSAKREVPHVPRKELDVALPRLEETRFAPRHFEHPFRVVQSDAVDAGLGDGQGHSTRSASQFEDWTA